MTSLRYTTVDRIIARLYRIVNEDDVNEDDVIEYVGEAMDFLSVPEIKEQAVAFVKIKDYVGELPKRLQTILQIARYNGDEDLVSEPKIECIDEYKDPEAICIDDPCQIMDCNFWNGLSYSKNNTQYEFQSCVDDHNIAKLKRLFVAQMQGYNDTLSFQYTYSKWMHNTFYRSYFSPVRLATSTFFNTLVQKEKDQSPYQSPSCKDEYTIEGYQEKVIKTSFRNGYIAVSYYRSSVDEETGYPLIPDDARFLLAATHYTVWQMSLRQLWSGRAGFGDIAVLNERLWLKYAGQAKSFARMPGTIDELQNMVEETHQLIPRRNRYYNYFGNIGNRENLNFGTNRRRFTKY